MAESATDWGAVEVKPSKDESPLDWGAKEVKSDTPEAWGAIPVSKESPSLTPVLEMPSQSSGVVPPISRLTPIGNVDVRAAHALQQEGVANASGVPITIDFDSKTHLPRVSSEELKAAFPSLSDKWANRIEGFQHGTVSAGEMFTDPEMMGIAGLPGTVQKAIGVVFGVKSAIEVPQAINRAIDAYKAGDEKGFGAAVSDAANNAFIAGVIAAGNGKTSDTPIPGSPDRVAEIKQDFSFLPQPAAEVAAGLIARTEKSAESLKLTNTTPIVQKDIPPPPGLATAPPQELATSSTPPEPPTIGEGPGATTAGKSPSPPQLEQLTSALEGKSISPERSLSERFAQTKKDATDWVASKLDKEPFLEDIAKLKANAQSVLDYYAKPPEFNNFDRIVGDWHFADTQAAKAVREFGEKMKKEVPEPVRREAIVNYIQADGDTAVLASREAASRAKPETEKFAEGYRIAQTLNPAEQTLAENFRNYYDSRFQEAADAGILKTSVDNYVNQVWEKANPVSDSIKGDIALGRLNTNPALAKQRVFDSYFEGEQAGYSPKNKDIGTLAAQYDLALNRAISSRAFIKSLYEGKLEDGAPMALLEGRGTPVTDNAGVPEAYLIQPHTMETSIFAQEKPYQRVDHPALKGWKYMGTDESGKPIMLQADMVVHPDLKSKMEAMLEKSRVRQSPVGKTLLNLQGIAKQTKLDLSAFHPVQVGIHALGHGVLPIDLPKIDLNDPIQASLIKHGLQVEDYNHSNIAMEGLTGGSQSLLQKITGLKQVLGHWNNWMFREFIPQLKMKTAQVILDRNRKIAGNQMSEDSLLKLSAEQANAAYGELNYRMMYRHPTTQDILRLTTLAPDFLEARFGPKYGMVGQALGRYGNEQRLNLAAIGLTLWTASRILNKLSSDDKKLTDTAGYHFDKPFTVISNGHEYGLRTMVGDIQHLFTDPRSFGYNRLSPTARTAIELGTMRDDRGIKRTPAEVVKDVGSWLIPISLNPRDDSTLAQTVEQGVGIRDTRYSPGGEIYKMAQDWMKHSSAKVRSEAERKEAEANPASDYRPLIVALQKEDKEAAVKAYWALKDEKGKTDKQINAYFTADHPFTGSKTLEKQFRSDLSTEDQKLYNQAIEERHGQKAIFNKLVKQPVMNAK